jgi:hemerythrin-like domain-containing protein
MTPTETLRHEHQIILLVLGGTEQEAASIAATGWIDAEKVGKLIDFSRNFTDRCHHAKEERHLFPALAEHGIAVEGGPIGVMLAEHEEGRRHVRAVAEALAGIARGDATAIATIGSELAGYVELLRAHIGKENDVLFVMADRVLPADEQTALAAAFERVEAEEIGEGVHEQYHQLAHELGEH